MMMNLILKNSFFKKRLNFLEYKKNLYQIPRSEQEIHNYQIKKFNKVWQKAINEIPFYQLWKKKFNLPEKIENINELKSFPILKKKHIQKNEKLIFQSLKNYSIISTGGSTGSPTKFPTSYNETINSYANHYLARGWWNIKPLDHILMFWGHSHLFGSGIKGQINRYKRSLYDWLINTKRLNAYDMSLNTIDKYFQILRKSNPSMIIGYTSCIYKIAKYIDENKLDIGNKSNLKGVVATSETVTDYDKDLFEKVFNVPCIIEYGMAETGVLAYSTSEGKKSINLFWDTFIGIKDEDDILNITTINDRLFPLINYKSDDIIFTNDDLSILKIEKILGRKIEFIKIKVGKIFVERHSELLSHVLKSIKGIYNFKVIQKKNMAIEIEYVSPNILNISDSFFSELSKELDNVDKTNFSFKQVDSIPKTMAGKEKCIEVEK